ncbi:MAG: DUF2087 domain-containing protein [Devosia sp.]|nr:DUF2087 domain-containing protein [Devosia sp.]
MARISLPFAVADTSALARALKRDIDALGRQPGHVDLLNMLARAAGYSNFQHFRARAARPAPRPNAEDERVERARRHFDAAGRLLRWPSRADALDLCLWVLWSRLPDAILDERSISALLDRWHVFGDHAVLRRALYDYGFVDRTVDGREYRRLERKPPPEAARLIGLLQAPPAAGGAP